MGDGEGAVSTRVEEYLHGRSQGRNDVRCELREQVRAEMEVT